MALGVGEERGERGREEEEEKQGDINGMKQKIKERNRRYERSGSNPIRAAVTPVNLFKGEREIMKETQCKASEELLMWAL